MPTCITAAIVENAVNCRICWHGKENGTILLLHTFMDVQGTPSTHQHAGCCDKGYEQREGNSWIWKASLKLAPDDSAFTGIKHGRTNCVMCVLGCIAKGFDGGGCMASPVGTGSSSIFRKLA